jgi:hypothetical protein
MFVEDFQAGDILLFRIDENSDWISRAISILTNSDVSHAALYMGKNILSDEGLNGLACHQIADDMTGRPIYIERLNPDLDMSPVLQAASKMIGQQEPYNKLALVQLGLLLLYKKGFPIDSMDRFLLKWVFDAATIAINEYLQKIFSPGKEPMVCSQYVYQCYQDAGTDYQLIIQNPLLLEKNTKQQISLMEAMQKYKKTELKQKQPLPVQMTATEINNTAMGEKFVRALKNINTTKNKVSVPAMNHDLIESIFTFSKQADSFAAKNKRTINSMLVTPADLENCINLIDKGSAVIDRNDAPLSAF